MYLHSARAGRQRNKYSTVCGQFLSRKSRVVNFLLSNGNSLPHIISLTLRFHISDISRKSHCCPLAPLSNVPLPQSLTVSPFHYFNVLTVYRSHCLSVSLFRCLTSMPCELNVGQTVTLPLSQCPAVPLPNCTMSHSQNAQLPSWPMPLCHTCPYSPVESVFLFSTSILPVPPFHYLPLNCLTIPFVCINVSLSLVPVPYAEGP
jgi:hypothetical protein